MRKFLSRKFQAARAYIKGKLPAHVHVIEDKWVDGLILAAIIVYFADMWDPLPIGESIASVFIAIAVVRVIYLEKKK